MITIPLHIAHHRFHQAPAHNASVLGSIPLPKLPTQALQGLPRYYSILNTRPSDRVEWYSWGHHMQNGLMTGSKRATIGREEIEVSRLYGLINRGVARMK